MNSSNNVPDPFESIQNQLNRIESILFELRERQLLPSAIRSSEDKKDTGLELAMIITGWKRKTIYNLVCKRMIPHCKKGKTLYFDEQELKDWIKSGKRLTQEEAEKLA